MFLLKGLVALCQRDFLKKIKHNNKNVIIFMKLNLIILFMSLHLVEKLLVLLPIKLYERLELLLLLLLFVFERLPLFNVLDADLNLLENYDEVPNGDG